MPDSRPGEDTPQDFTVHQLVVFCTVARYLSYTKAAESLYLSQPAVTQQVRAVEQALGLRLFERKGRGIILTLAGQEFLLHSERLLVELDKTRGVVEEIHALERGSIALGASASAGTYVVPPLLGAFHTRYPAIQITLAVANRSVIEEQLLNHEVELAVMSIIERRERFVVEFLTSYELVMVASPAHRLAARSALALRELQLETILLREKGAGTRLDTEHHFELEGLSMRSFLELGSIEAIKEGVIAGLGIAVLPRDSVAFELTGGDVVMLDVQGFPLHRQWHLVHLKGRRLSLAADSLRHFLLDNRSERR